MIAGFDGITSVKLNPRVGSLLVTWDETKTNAESLLAAAQFFLPDEPAAEEAAEVFEGVQDQDAQPEAAKWHFEGPAVCFDSQEDACEGILGGKVNSGDCVVITHEGPKGVWRRTSLPKNASRCS